MVDQTKLTKTKYVAGKSNLSRHVNSKDFVHYSAVTDDIFEVLSTPRQIAFDTPIQIGYWVLQLAKLRLLEFVYLFIRKYLNESAFQISQCDTDAVYISLSKSSFEEAVKPEMRESYNTMVYGSCTNGADPDQEVHLSRSVM